MLLVDTLMLIRRCYAKMDFLKSPSGQPTGLEFGTLRTLESLQKKYPEQQVVLCLDSARSCRRERCPSYKANRVRVLDDNYYVRLKAFMKFLRAVYHTAEKHGFEADDVMYALSRTYVGPHLIYTNDHDLLQAVNDAEVVAVLRSFKSELFVWDEAKVREKYDLPPELLPEYFAFIGDKGDNVTGVLRISREYLRDLIRWAHENDLSRHRMCDEIKNAEWSPKLKERVIEFVDSGKFEENYQLIKLRIRSDVKIKKPTNDDEYVTERLKRWDVHTLELCKKHGLDIENEEF